MSELLRWFDPERLPARDEMGYTDHPDMWEERWFDGKPEDEAPMMKSAFEAVGLEICLRRREDDEPGYSESEGAGCALWTPTSPEGDGWRIAAIYSDDDGDAALFVRDKTREQLLARVVELEARLAVSNGLALIATEHRRQIEVKGYTPQHDDEHVGGELADAAACYAAAAAAITRGASPEELHDPAGDDFSIYTSVDSGPTWPWADETLKLNKDPVRNLVKAGALIVAEIERLQRAQAASAKA